MPQPTEDVLTIKRRLEYVIAIQRDTGKVLKRMQGSRYYNTWTS